MKKLIFFVVIVMIALLGIYSRNQSSWSSRIFYDPSLKVVQRCEYLRMVSQQYYGTSKYWSDLALVNRIADVDGILPGEIIIIPEAGAIQKLHATQSMDFLNEIIANHEHWLAQHKVESVYAPHFEQPSS